MLAMSALQEQLRIVAPGLVGPGPESCVPDAATANCCGEEADVEALKIRIGFWCILIMLSQL